MPELAKTGIRNVAITIPELHKLKKAWKKARDEGQEDFKFKVASEEEPLHFVTKFAEYYLEYLENQFGKL